MPWQLDIHIIDVGQGESSLIIATNTTTGTVRSMLIDGGLATYARTVHRYMLRRGLTHGPDHILVTHYDDDHTGGVAALLIADNVYHVSNLIATAAANLATALGAPNTRPDRAAAAAAAAYAVAQGCYNDLHGNDHSAAVASAVTASHVNYNGRTDEYAVDDALKQVDRALGGSFNPWLIPGIRKMRATARAAGLAAARSIAHNGAGAGLAAALVTMDTRTAVFNSLRTGVGAESRFQTDGIYGNAHIIDIGNTNHTGRSYTDAIDGIYTVFGNQRVQAIGTNRSRTGPPTLGSEILWNTGAGAAAAPANSPAVFVIARLKRTWNGIGRTERSFNGPQPDNDDSIGLIVRFNHFYYFTGGDLPSSAEDQIAEAVMKRPLPNPQNALAPFATPARIAAFKCGHHGSQHSTSQTFLNRAKPRGAFISCGRKQFGTGDNHPTQALINRLHNCGTLRYFYLTNCKYFTNHVPASQGPLNQIVMGNKSRVAGVNNNNVTDARSDIATPRRRGNIRLRLNEAESDSAYTAAPPPGNVLRRYHVRYYDEDSNINNFRTEDTIF